MPLQQVTQLYSYSVLKERVRELAYNFDVDGYLAPDMTILAEHITETGITQMAYQQEPNQIIWMVYETDGQLIGLTYQREQQVSSLAQTHLWW
jgi:hypothetical protein